MSDPLYVVRRASKYPLRQLLASFAMIEHLAKPRLIAVDGLGKLPNMPPTTDVHNGPDSLCRCRGFGKCVFHGPTTTTKKKACQHKKLVDTDA